MLFLLIYKLTSGKQSRLEKKNVEVDAVMERSGEVFSHVWHVSSGMLMGLLGTTSDTCLLFRLGPGCSGL